MKAKVSVSPPKSNMFNGYLAEHFAWQERVHKEGTGFYKSLEKSVDLGRQEQIPIEKTLYDSIDKNTKEISKQLISYMKAHDGEMSLYNSRYR